MRSLTTRSRCFALVASCTLVSLSYSTVWAAFTEQGASILGGANLNARSASLADIDGDGDLDLMFQGFDGPRLFRNNFIGGGTLTFTNVSSTMLPSTGLGSSWSAAWGDYNGDGRIDVFIGQTNAGSNVGDVLRNNWPAPFTNESPSTGLLDPGFHQNLAWNDIDRDGDLDLMISMELVENKHEIYLQGPAGSFTRVGAAVGFQAPVGFHGYGMAIGDTDGDGDLDVYISTCQPGGNIRNTFFKNMLAENGSLGFVDIADTNGTQYMANSYGSEFHDFDDDGDLDLIMVGADGNRSKLFRNNGNNMFTDVDTITGHPLLSDVAGDLNGGRAIDYDNDGDLDLFFHDQRAVAGISNQARKLYRNDGNWQFTDVTVAEGIHATNETGHDSVWGDIDLDGDLDLIAANGGATGLSERVFINDASTNRNHWLYIKLAGPSGNTTGIGAALYATLNEGTPQERTLRRDANTNAGTFNQSDVPVHFGLGSATEVDRLRIVWPMGQVQYLFDVAADQYLTVEFAGELHGDFNGDGSVDAADYILWRKFSGPQQDYQMWRSHFGLTVGGGSSGSLAERAAPEPATMWLASVVVVALLRCRARGRCHS